MKGELCRVLIVDDELLIRQGIKHYMQWEKEGFTIVGEASNGREALSLIDDVHPHIVMTDIVMPVMDGEELTKMIRTAHPDIQVIVLSSFGEFDYVRSTFQQGVTDYILKPKLEGELLLKALQNAADKIPSFQLVKKGQNEEASAASYLKKWMDGFGDDMSEEKVKRLFPHAAFFVMSVRMNQKEEKRRYVKEDIEKQLKQGLPDADCYPLSFQGEYASFFINMDVTQQQPLLQLAQKIARASTDLSVSVSEPFFEARNVKDVFDQEKEHLKQYTFYFPDQFFFYREMLRVIQSDAPPFDMAVCAEKIKRGQWDEAFAEIMLHVDHLSQNYLYDIQEFKRFLSNVVFNVTLLAEAATEKGAKFSKDKYAYFAAIDRADRADEAVGQLTGFLEEVQKTRQPVDQTDPGIKKIMDYIDQHYSDPLTLTDVANHFHFNPSYLSTYFGHHNSEGFSGYLTKIRIEKAVELLQQRHISISAISGEVGYADHSYFCKVFKKIKGMSPSSYRKQFFL